MDSHDWISRSISPEDLPDPRRSLDLLGDAQSGNREALEELVRRYQDRLRRIVRIQLGRSALRRDFESMDIVQSTFKAALPKITELRPTSAASLLQWLSIIATNQIRDAHDWRHAQKRDGACDVRLDDSRAEHRAGAVDQDNSPEDAAVLSEIRDLLDAEVARLADDQRRVVVLRDYCGESWDRIAAELEREDGAARQLHQRAWIKLRQALRPKIEGRA